MSVVPEAFEWVRACAYQRWGRMPKADRRVEEVAAWCTDDLRAWRAAGEGRGELSDAQIASMSQSVAQFVVRKLGEMRKRPAARTTAEGRAAEKLMIGIIVPEDLEEEGRAVTARAVAEHLGVSERKASRALAEGRGTPKRAARVAMLTGTERTVFDLAEALLPRDGFCVLRASEFEARLWPKPADTDAACRKRRSRLQDAFGALMPLSFHVVAKGDLLALRRGRRWKPDDAAARLNAATSKPGLVASIPASPTAEGLYWESIEVRGLMAALRVAMNCGADPEVFRDFLAIQRLVLDGRAIMNIHAFAHRISGWHNHWCHDLPAFFSRAAVGEWGIRTEPQVRSALIEIGGRIAMLEEDGRWGRSAVDAVHSLFSHQSRGRPLLECFNDSARARMEAFFAIVDAPDGHGGWIDCTEALALCERLSREESAGTWSAAPWLEHGTPF